VLAQILEDQLQVFVSSLAAHLSVTEVKKQIVIFRSSTEVEY
jgi:hypothetical protein